MTDVKTILDKAKFKIDQGIPYEAYIIKSGKFKTVDYKTDFPLIFAAKDILVDAVMIDMRPTPRMSKWARKIPMEVIDYAYKMVPHKRISFVWPVGEDGNTQIDIIVCILEDKYVQMNNEYKALYQPASETVARR